MRVWPGRPDLLGATWDGAGVNFALFSEHATRVELCLFDARAQDEVRIPLPEKTNQVWHGYFPDLRPGQLYGYRVHGQYNPKEGHRFNPNKLLLDPYARAIGRDVRWSDEMYGYRIGDRRKDLSYDERDNVPFAPLGMVIDTAFTWGGDRAPRTPWRKTLIYELHVRGFTQLHQDVPEELRGTYAGVASEPALRHLRSLGVTAVELMPVHHHLDDRDLVERGLSNYWGYNTLAFFAPEVRYASRMDARHAVGEFKTMVRTLHSEGIEVILDVVYNHTAEGSELGPTLSFRGIDNSSYYRLMPKEQRYYEDFTGCGNTLNMRQPRVLQLIMDSLRYWVLEMHVDGFRFDLASALARELYAVDRLSAFFDIIHQDPVLSQVKLIAEPWDLGEGGYQVGNFPSGWTEWNGKYRDSVRSSWRGDGGAVAELATRLTGSSDLYEESGRRPHASVNFVTSHDGFSLHDLVSYDEKHNEDNGHDNQDGDDHNLSWNSGAEGPSEDPEVQDLRERQKRNFIATLFLSQGVPMLRAGDELSHTQRGNNNGYCQDNDISWLRWELNDSEHKFLDFVRQAVRLWSEQTVLHRRKFLQGRSIRGSDVKDISWLDPSGQEMNDDAWNAPFVRTLGMRLSGSAMDEIDERGFRIQGDTLLVLMNAHHDMVRYTLPEAPPNDHWIRVFDTAVPGADSRAFRAGTEYEVHGRSLCVLRVPNPEGRRERRELGRAQRISGKQDGTAAEADREHGGSDTGTDGQPVTAQ